MHSTPIELGRTDGVVVANQVKLDSATVLESIQTLKQDWGKLQKQPPCFSLTPEVLYGNAEEYLGRILMQDQD